MKMISTRFFAHFLFLGLFAFTFSASFGQSYTIGSDDGSNISTSYPAPFGDWYKTQRTQFLYLASDLIGAGMSAGDINSIAFTVEVVDPTINATEGYTIKLLSTGTSSLGLTTWESGATEVWGPSDYTPTVGVNTFTLTTPYNWDGSSNIIIEICGGSSLGTYTYNAESVWSGPFAYNASHTYRSDIELSPCSYTGTTYSDYTPGGPDYRPQVIFEVTPGTDCTGTPVAGAASSTTGSVCVDENFTVSIEPSTGGGISYQWGSSTDGFTWSDIIGATSPSYVTTQTEATWYNCTVTCAGSGESAISDAVYVDQNAPTDCYCEPTYTTGTTFGDYIQTVELGTINNTTGAGDAPYYAYYSDLSTDVSIGYTYTINVTVGTYTNNDIAAWIDYNADGSFDDVTEKLGEVEGLLADAIGSITFTIPADATIGSTRIRVREADQALDIESCETLTYGETEDYNINIGTSNCDTPTGLYADDITSTSATLNWEGVDGVSGYTIKVWNLGTSIIKKVPAGSDATSITLTDGLTAGTSYAFKIKSACLATEEFSLYSDWYYFTTGFKFGQLSEGINIYPNPSNGIVNVEINGAEENVELHVVNTIGEEVITKIIAVTSPNFVESLDLSDLASGMYQVIIRGGKISTSTIVIE